MPTLILARHGRTTANATGVLAGRTSGVHLDDHGIDQARAAAKRLEGLTLSAVVTSPLERCRETADVLAAGSAAVLTVDTGLEECDYGEWTGRAIKELVKEPLWAEVQAHPAGARFPGGESMSAMSSRGIAAVRDRDRQIEAEHGSGAVWLAVSHGDVIKAILADALGLHLDAFQRIVVEPASLSVIRYTSTRPFVVTMNSREGSLADLEPRPDGVADGDAVVGGG